MNFLIKAWRKTDPHLAQTEHCMKCTLYPRIGECRSRFCLDCCRKMGHGCEEAKTKVKTARSVSVDNSRRRYKVVNSHTDGRQYQTHNHYYGAPEMAYREPESLPPPSRRQALQAESASRAIARRQSSDEQFAAQLIELTGADYSVEDVLGNPTVFQQLTLAAARR